MKGHLFGSIAGIALALGMGIAANGQLATSNVQLSTIGSEKSTSANHVFFKRKAVRELERGFENVSGENWFKTPEGYHVRFNHDNVDHLVFYDNKGKKLYTIRNYDETKLPVDIRHQVKGAYYDYDIRLVQEIESASGDVAYLIHLEGKTKWINVRVSNGEMDVFEKYTKSE